MTDHERVTELFLAALGRPRSQRAAFLADACGGDAELLGEVEALLAQDERTGATEVMARGIVDAVIETASSRDDEPLPERFGSYRILELLGQGAMGVVYRARQSNPDREVALKVIAGNLPTPDLVRRFEIEAQALGRLHHPAIAQIIEAGAVDNGFGSQSYFAMELVDGLPILQYTERHELDLRRRVALVARICDAVQHAHQRGVIHRDLKPANILVDESGNPKILDFGIARLADAYGDAAAARTSHGSLLGTLGYMSPEQARGDLSDLDTRVDVYSLGAVAFECLTGLLPHDLVGLSLPQAIRVVSEEPPRRLSATGRRLPSDLEAIVGKALDPDRGRRYASAAELAADLHRFLDGRPVAARHPSVLYQLRKLVERNRLTSALAGVIFLIVVGSGIAAAVQANSLRIARDAARREADVANEVSRFLGDVFRLPDPGESRGRSVTAREVLDLGAERIRNELRSAPEVQARLMLAMGEAYQGLGLAGEAAELFRSAADAETHATKRDPWTHVQALTRLAWGLRSQRKYDEGLALSLEAEETALAAFGGDAVQLANPLLVSGVLLRDKRLFDDAAERIEHARAIYERVEGPESEDVGRALYHQGWLLHLQSEDEAALGTYERACRIIESAASPDHPLAAWCQNDLSVVLSTLGRHDEAVVALNRSIRIRERILPPNHPDLASAIDNLGSLHWKAREFEAAAEAYRRALDMRRASLGPEHADVANSQHNLALAMRDLGRREEAIDLLRSANEIYRKTIGPDHPTYWSSVGALSAIHLRRGDLAEALRLDREIRQSRERTKGPDDPSVARSLVLEASDLLQLGRPREAEPLLERARTIVEKTRDAERSQLAAPLERLGRCRELQGRWSEAEDLYVQVQQLADSSEKVDEGSTAMALEGRSRLARRRGDRESADRLLQEAIERLERIHTSGFASYARAVAAAHAGQRDEALDLLRRAFEAGLPPSAIDLDVELAPLRNDSELRSLLRESHWQPAGRQAT